MKRKMFSLLVLAAAFLTGCTLIPEYTRPVAPVPAEWPTGPSYKEAPSQERVMVASETKWREFFVDERLREIIETALRNNRDLRAAALNVERAQALYRVQRGALLPTVDGAAGGFRSRVPGEVSGDTLNFSGAVTAEQWGTSLGISSWEIDLFGRIRSLSKRALEEYFATEHARRSAQVMLISEVANVYLTLAADRDNLKLAQSTLESQHASYELIRQRFDAGLAPELDLRQVQTRVDSARVDVAKFTELSAQDENALNLLVGSPVPAELLPEALGAVAPPTDVSPGISSEVLLSRPDILQAESQLKATNANIGAARAAFFPRISLTSSVGTASGDLTGLFKSGSLAWSYAPQIVMPIFDARLWPALRASKVDKEIAVAQYEKAIQSAFREVADALASKGTLGDKIEAQKSLVSASDTAYRLSYSRYEKGTDIYLNALDAQRSLYAAQQGLISIRLAQLANQVRLYAVLGGGQQ